jgi:hypothetical protein
MNHRFPFALAAVAVLAIPARARAAGAEITAPSAGLTREWIGLEVTPVSLALASAPAGREGHLDTSQAGLGVGIRLARYRWDRAYVIPVEAGFYFTSHNRTIFAHLQLEGGFIVGSDRRLEVGIGAGLGALAMSYANTCDGSCVVGGAGPLISVVARYLFISTPTWTLGASTRLIVPLSTPGGEFFGYYTGSGSLLLGGLEVAFGPGSG